MKTVQDERFGLLTWYAEFQEWQGVISLSPIGTVGVDLPAEYIDSLEVRKKILDTMQIIERDELGFRQRAANELFTEGGYTLFLDEYEQFNPDQFVQQMHLAGISFTPDFPNTPLTLGYEYADGVEHGISVYLSWEGVYRSARVA